MIKTYPQEQAQLSALRGAEYNPRDMSPAEMAKLKRSLREFGFVQPIIARRADGLIVGGHQRASAMQQIADEDKLGDVSVPVIFIEIDDDRAKVLNLALNKISGDWDYTKLTELLSSLTAAVPFEMVELSGFSAVELKDLLDYTPPSPTPAPPPIDPDAVIEAEAREFKFNVPTRADADFCRDVLKEYGMAGLTGADTAFLEAMRAAHAAKTEDADASAGLHGRGNEGDGGEVDAGGGADGRGRRKPRSA